jgi:hypothetical protein
MKAINLSTISAAHAEQFLADQGQPAPAGSEPFAIPLYGDQSRWIADSQAGRRLTWPGQGWADLIIRRVVQVPDEYVQSTPALLENFATTARTGVFVGASWFCYKDPKNFTVGYTSRIDNLTNALGAMNFGEGSEDTTEGKVLESIAAANMLVTPLPSCVDKLLPEQIDYQQPPLGQMVINGVARLKAEGYLLEPPKRTVWQWLQRQPGS